MEYSELIPVFSAVIFGLVLCLVPRKVFDKNRVALHIVSFAGMMISSGLTLWAINFGDNKCDHVYFELMKGIPIVFRIDSLGTIFAMVATICFILAIIFSFRYIDGDNRYYGFMLFTYGALIGLDFAGNLVTMYLFFEMLTLLSFPLVLQTKTHESIMAALKYLFYSLTGAYMGLFAIYVLYQNTTKISFVSGGTIDPEKMAEHPTLVLIACMAALIGFGVKAGMFPMHAWLPTAHPVAPAPASAVLSGVIVKGGVLCIIRVVYYIVGSEVLAGTWVQTAWMILSLTTVFMGSLLAYREPVLKKRLAYSTVSQVSYILFGLSVFNEMAFQGALLHVIFHAFIKCALFLCAGAIIHETGKERVDELTGIGKKMPVTTTLFTVASLGLIGIPPTGGFISKWYLAVGALNSTTAGVFRFIGPAVLLVSALLTAGYLLPVTVKGFFPGSDFDYELPENRKHEAPAFMWVSILILVILVVAGGLFPNVLEHVLTVLAKICVKGV